MCSKNRISQHTQASHMNTRILGGNPIREKTTAAVVSVFNIYYNENILQLCTGADSYQYAGTHLQKATTFSHLPASPGRELQTPTLIYQPLLEGSYYPCSRLPAFPGRELQHPSLVPSIFTRHTLQTTGFIRFLQRCILNSAICFPFHTDILQSEVFIHNPYTFFMISSID